MGQKKNITQHWNILPFGDYTPPCGDKDGVRGIGPFFGYLRYDIAAISEKYSLPIPNSIAGSTTDLATPVISHFDRLSFKISQDYGGDLSNVDPSASAKDHSSQSTIDPPPHTPPVAQRRRSVSSSSSSSLGNNKVDPGTVLNMATREIIDSERKYIEDLQEVIVGYLADWKERACLKVDEIETLFGNIEQIYDCSRSLMDRLSLSKSDPLKIAACFIDFKDQFENVYSTYWYD